MSWNRRTLCPLLATVIFVAGCHSNETTSAEPPVAIPGPPKAKTVGAPTRRNVKTGMDPDAGMIDRTPKDISIEQIVAQKGPLDGKLEGRVGPFETSTWRVKATLASIKLMKDGDFYLVMKGAKGGETVVEVPDPKECKDSPLGIQVAAARAQLESRYHPTTTVQKLNDEATVTGVGFLGWGGGKKGATGHSGPRLMPGLGFLWDEKPKS